MELKPSVNLREYINWTTLTCIALYIGSIFFPILSTLAKFIMNGVILVALTDYWWIETGLWDRLKEDFKTHFMK